MVPTSVNTQRQLVVRSTIQKPLRTASIVHFPLLINSSPAPRSHIAHAGVTSDCKCLIPSPILQQFIGRKLTGARMFAYIVFNIAAAVLLYYLFRVRKSSGKGKKRFEKLTKGLKKGRNGAPAEKGGEKAGGNADPTGV